MKERMMRTIYVRQMNQLGADLASLLKIIGC